MLRQPGDNHAQKRHLTDRYQAGRAAPRRFAHVRLPWRAVGLVIRTWSTYKNHFLSASRRERMIEGFTPGAEGHAVWVGPDVRPQDLKAHQRRFGAFVPRSADLHAVLQDRGIDTLIMTGTASQGMA